MTFFKHPSLNFWVKIIIIIITEASRNEDKIISKNSKQIGSILHFSKGLLPKTEMVADK